MAIQIRKAKRTQARLRLAMFGPTGSGKTYSALKMAFGIGSKIGIIDTENGSADLYADIGDYDVIPLEKPYTVQKYRDAIAAFEHAGYDVIIIDSLTHAWAGAGGLLDRKTQAEKRGVNSFTAWGDLTPDHQALIDAMLTSPAHIIATARVKMEYVLELNEKGKQVPRKIGLAPVFRDGLEYEFTVVMDVDYTHRASASKDRTRLFDGWCDQITPATGKLLKDWLETGESAPAPPPPPNPLDSVRALLAKCETAADVISVGEKWNAAMQKAAAAGRPMAESVSDDAKELIADRYSHFMDEADQQEANEPEGVE